MRKTEFANCCFRATSVVFYACNVNWRSCWLLSYASYDYCM